MTKSSGNKLSKGSRRDTSVNKPNLTIHKYPKSGSLRNDVTSMTASLSSYRNKKISV